ncbi:MAG: arginine deiminase family protein [Verrucomicrobiota bacterium]
MSLTAIVREVSPSINECELSFHTRQPIDVGRAAAQHQIYRGILAELGLHLVALPAEPALPDAVFVEDPAVVLDELAVIAHMGAPSRRREAESLAKVLARYRKLAFLKEPATLDGGDVLRVARTLFVGLSRRTNQAAIDQLAELLREHAYTVKGVAVRRCLHLKSACSYIGQRTMLINRSWIDARPFSEFEMLDVPEEEAAAGNALLLNDVVILPASFPRTRALLQKRGFRVRTVDLSELQKAEAGVTCTSLIF